MLHNNIAFQELFIVFTQPDRRYVTCQYLIETEFNVFERICFECTGASIVIIQRNRA